VSGTTAGSASAGPGEHPSHRPLAVIGALTFRRPVGLARLLDELGRLDRPATHDVVVVIVDNDPDGSAAEVVAAHAPAWPPVRLVAEPERGISVARNRAVAEARSLGAESITFIDDDEWPVASWFTELLAVQRDTGADVVHAPVEAVFDEPPPAWVLAGAFFDRPRFPDRTPMRWATTSNVLISLAVLDGVRGPDGTGPFDRRFDLTGGGDTHLFAVLRERGARIVWSDRALVYEAIPTSRVDRDWLVRREFRRGNTLSLSMKRRGGLTPVSAVKRTGHGVVRIAQGAAQWVAGATVARRRGPAAAEAARVTGVRTMAFGAGMLAGLAGRRYVEYARGTHGR
jgi:succinoglycan biosynthesis protein ExoM